jgi:alpha-L-fucosidase
MVIFLKFGTMGPMVEPGITVAPTKIAKSTELPTTTGPTLIVSFVTFNPILSSGTMAAIRADLRWVGTEGGWVGETNWSLLNAAGEVPYEMLHYGVEDGDSWVPAEVNTSIRPEWFYHPGEDTKVKTLPQLMDTYYNSVGRNGTLLLNFPIMPNGLIHPNDEKVALDLASAVKEAFSENLVKNARAEAGNVRGDSREFSASNAIDDKMDTYWATDDDVKAATLTIDFGKPATFNRFLAQEYTQFGTTGEIIYD